MENFKVVILAAGQGTRMKSKLPKVLHKIMDKTLLQYVIDAAKEAGAGEICVVVGHKGELVEQSIKEDVKIVVQEEQLGTGHAVMQAKDFIGHNGQVVILFGDTPLITGDTIKKLCEYHNKNNNAVTVLSTIIDNPYGYGRIIRNEQEKFIKSVEHKDATEEEKNIKEVNSGMYVFNACELYDSLGLLTNNNAQKEYYLPDTLEIIMNKGLTVDAMVIDDYTEILGVNSRVQLSTALDIIQQRINTFWNEKDVTIINTSQTYISKDAVIENDVIIYPNSFIEGKCYIAQDSIIGPNTRICNSKIGRGVSIEQSVVLYSEIGNNTNIGPFAYIRPNSIIGENVKVGDFVEVKNSTIGNNTKASHLTYIGDAQVGSNVNFGCGTVVVNYDGSKKHLTIIEDNAFIGCNTNLISPVKVCNNAYTAAGSTINKEVPPDSLGIARVRQENKIDWVKRNKR